MRLLLVIFSCVIIRCEACANTALSRDSELITDPTFTFSVSPPVRWTYYPRVISTGNVPVTNFFPGQSENSADALQAAQNEVLAAYLEALSQQPGITTQGVTTTVSYSPDEISNCYTGQAIPAGTRIGFLAGGAITQVALTSMMVTATTCPLSQTMQVAGIGPYQEYIKMVTVSTRGGITMTRFNWNRVTSLFQTTLNFRYQALFRSPIVISS